MMRVLLGILVLACSELAAGKGPEQAKTDAAVAAASAKGLHISAGGRHSCVIHDGALECWGDEEFQNNGKREGQFSAVECGSWHTCALDAEGIATCFGAGYALQSTVPAIPLKTVSAGFSDTCGIATGDGSIVCWGMKAEQDLKPPEGRFVQVSVGTRSACAISAHDGAVQCWGSDEFQQMSGAPQTTGFRSVSCGGGHTCALTKGGRLVCWGGSDEYRLGRGIPNTKTPHAQISAGEDHACALGQDGIVRCWGRCKQGACDPPASGKGSKGGRHVEYVAVAAGGLHTCAVRKEDGAIDCWGDVPTSASDGKPATPPAVGGAIRGSAGSGRAGEVEGGVSSPEITVDARGAAVDGLGAMLSRVRSMFSSPANSTEL